jgi:hypothetical protein
MAAHSPDFPKRWFCTCPKCQNINEVPTPYVLADCANCHAPLDLVKKHSIPDEREPGTRITEAPVEEPYYEPKQLKLTVDDRKFLVGLKIARF